MGHNCSHYSFSWACWHSLDLDMMISWRDKSPYQKDLCLRGWSCCRERVLLRSLNAYSKRPTPGVFIRERRDCGSQCRCWGRPLGSGIIHPIWLCAPGSPLDSSAQGSVQHRAGPGKIFVEWKPHCHVLREARACGRKAMHGVMRCEHVWWRTGPC